MNRDRLTKDRRSDIPSLAGAGEGGRRPGEGQRGKDHLSRERRSWNMSRIRGKHTTPEKVGSRLLLLLLPNLGDDGAVVRCDLVGLIRVVAFLDDIIRR